MCKAFCLLFISFSLYSSEVPNFKELSKSRNVVFLLSTPKSGSNWISASLSAITRKPISWLRWGDKVFDPHSELRMHPSYNRLGLSLVSDTPLLYRTHYEVDKLLQVRSERNQLIFLTRNPKELLFRAFFLQNPSLTDPDVEFIDAFLNRYLQAFEVYDAWCSKNRVLIFYEDFIDQEEETLIHLLDFMGEKPTYLDDFRINKQEYMSRSLESYAQQHRHNSGGFSAVRGPQKIYYSINARSATLAYIDDSIKRAAPSIWEKYLKRFQSPPTFY